jgi:murein DD-endopeptidase MepM/ murein hydrolase activator NlpD
MKKWLFIFVLCVMVFCKTTLSYAVDDVSPEYKAQLEAERAAQIATELRTRLAEEAVAKQRAVDEKKQHIQQDLIDKLESEIKVYEKNLADVGSQKRTLSNTIGSIELRRKQTQAAIVLTQEKIKIATKRIEGLGTQIQKKAQSITLNTLAASVALRTIRENDDHTFLELFLREGSVGTAWDAGEKLLSASASITDHVESLKKEKVAILALKTANEGEKKNLGIQERDSVEKKKGLEAVESEKRDLLKQTKNKESSYQLILRAKRDAKREFEEQMRAYESQLKYVLDESKIPHTGSGVLSYPVSKVVITQKFGQTAFAKSGAYNGKGHNGVDFGVSIGTPVKSAGGGMVAGTGNTDAHAGCYSYGKWILIRHTNGLATLYGHLSTISSSVGDSVSAGDTIGYSGNTGYSTGPHLHFTLFASDAVRIVRMADIGSRSGCRDASIPVAPTTGYLNPLDYL